jgi:hypothetical protein
MTTASRSAKRKTARKKTSSSASPLLLTPSRLIPGRYRLTRQRQPKQRSSPAAGGSFVQSVRDGSAFGAVARWSCGHAWFVVLAFLALAIGGATLAATKLKVDTDPNLMISADLDFKQSFAQFNETFPAVDANFVFVVDSDDPEQAKNAAFRLAEKLRSQPSLFAHVLAPGTGKFFDDYGILYAKPDEVEKLVSGIVEAGPMLKGLADQPNLAGLSGLLNEVTAYTQAGRAPGGFAGFLNKAAATVEAETAGAPSPMDWTTISDDDPKLTDTRWFVLTKPVLDFTQLEAAAGPMNAARALLEDPEVTGNGAATVRLTGEAAMDAEEFEAVTKGALTAGIVSFIIVSITIFFGLPSLRLIIPAMALIVLGFLINTGFATLSIGYLNMISVAFAVLFIGLGVDYAVHVVLRYAEERARGLSRTDAATAAVTKMGPALGTVYLDHRAGIPGLCPDQLRRHGATRHHRIRRHGDCVRCVDHPDTGIAEAHSGQPGQDRAQACAQGCSTDSARQRPLLRAHAVDRVRHHRCRHCAGDFPAGPVRRRSGQPEGSGRAFGKDLPGSGKRGSRRALHRRVPDRRRPQGARDGREIPRLADR